MFLLRAAAASEPPRRLDLVGFPLLTNALSGVLFYIERIANRTPNCHCLVVTFFTRPTWLDGIYQELLDSRRFGSCGSSDT